MGVCSCDVEIIVLLSNVLSLSLSRVRSLTHSRVHSSTPNEACIMISLSDLLEFLFKLDVS